MTIFSRLWKENQAFLLPFGICILACIFILAAWTKADVHLAIDAHHCSAGDWFFALVTNLGDGWAAVALVVVLLFVRYRFAILAAAANLVSAIVVQILKHGPFAGSARPWEYFRCTHVLHLVPGVQMYSYNSFPSGHAATTSACCFCLALMTRHRGTKSALSVVGIAIAFSRVYLSEHFLGDMCAGGLLGVVVSLVFAVALEHRSLSPGGQWLELSLLRRSGRPDL